MTIEKTPGPAENIPPAAPSESASPVSPVAASSVQSDNPPSVVSLSTAGEAPKKKGGARPGAGRKPGPQKAARVKAGPPPSPLSGSPEAQLAEAVAAAPPEVREALTALADPMKLAPLLHGGVESAVVAVARTRYGKQADDLRADKGEAALIHTATGMYLASLNITLTPVQLLVGISLLVYGPKVAALEGARRKALPSVEKVQNEA